jgi:hypothetical protein
MPRPSRTSGRSPPSSVSRPDRALATNKLVECERLGEIAGFARSGRQGTEHAELDRAQERLGAPERQAELEDPLQGPATVGGPGIRANLLWARAPGR